MQIKHKLLLSFVAIIVVPFLLVGYFSLRHASDMTQAQVSDALYRLAQQNGMTVERTLDGMNDKTLKFIDEHFTEDAKAPIDLKNIDESNYNTVSELISKYSLDGTSYVLYARRSGENQDELPFEQVKSGLIFASKEDLPEYYEEAVKLRGTGIIRFVSFGNSIPTICYIRAILEPGTTDHVLGVLYVTNLEILLYNDIWSSQIPSGSGVYLLNDRSEILVSMPDRPRGDILELPKKAQLPVTGRETVSWNGKETLFTHIFHTKYDTKLVYEVPVKSMIGQQESYQRVLLIVMTLCFLLIAGYLAYLAGVMLGPLGKLSRVAEKYEPGMTFNIGKSVRRKDEIGKVYDSFDRMTERVNQLVRERYILEMKQQEMELITLHTQVTPHLLYNTLDSIYWLAIDKDKPELARMVKDLSSLLRIGLSRGRELVAVREELQHIQAYVRLQLERYNHVFSVHWEVDDGALELLTPKVILQPIVENSILHGVGKMDGEGEIWISIAAAGEHLTFIIEDNGFKASDPELLNRQLANGEGGYGIRNVDRRIKLHFGASYGICYSARTGGGLRAEIRLPIRRPDIQAASEGSS